VGRRTTHWTRHPKWIKRTHFVRIHHCEDQTTEPCTYCCLVSQPCGYWTRRLRFGAEPRLFLHWHFPRHGHCCQMEHGRHCCCSWSKTGQSSLRKTRGRNAIASTCWRGYDSPDTSNPSCQSYSQSSTPHPPHQPVHEQQIMKAVSAEL
jgi:hypothetical protein